MPFLYAVIGDLVGSRKLADRAAAQDTVREALDSVNRDLRPAQPFEATVGDEFQGATADLATAVRATLLVRLRMQPVVDARCGIGAGEVTVHGPDQRPLLQDGPGWWNARTALEELDRRKGSRSWYVGPGDGAVTAFLLTRDALVERLNPRGRRLLEGALSGASQRELAEREGISPSAVSQQFARGVGALRDAHLRFDHPAPTDPSEPTDPSGGQA